MKILKVIYNMVAEAWCRICNPKLKNAFQVLSHLTTRERVALFLLSREKSMVVEIGSYIGASACCFGTAMKESDRGKLLCIDTWNNDAMTEGNRDTFVEFKSNIR